IGSCWKAGSIKATQLVRFNSCVPGGRGMRLRAACQESSADAAKETARRSSSSSNLDKYARIKVLWGLESKRKLDEALLGVGAPAVEIAQWPGDFLQALKYERAVFAGTVRRPAGINLF